MAGAGQIQEVTGVHKYYRFKSLYIYRITRQDSRKCDNYKSSSQASGGG